MQPIVFDYHGVLMKATVRAVNTLDGMDGAPLGLLMDGTEIMWSKDPTTNMKLKNTSKRWVETSREDEGNRR
jgi:vesicle-fusing ATPase